MFLRAFKTSQSLLKYSKNNLESIWRNLENSIQIDSKEIVWTTKVFESNQELLDFISNPIELIQIDPKTLKIG